MVISIAVGLAVGIASSVVGQKLKVHPVVTMLFAAAASIVVLQVVR